MDEHADHKQADGVENEGPGANEKQGYAGFEWFHLRHFFGDGQGVESGAHQSQQDRIFEQNQAPVPVLGHFDLAELQFLAKPGGHFLQGAKRAEPAAEKATAPDEQGYECVHPENKDDRIQQEHIERETVPDRQEQGVDVNHRKLALGVEADKEQGEEQKSPAEPVYQLRVAAQGFLAGEEHGQNGQADYQQ